MRWSYFNPQTLQRQQRANVRMFNVCFNSYATPKNICEWKTAGSRKLRKFSARIMWAHMVPSINSFRTTWQCALRTQFQQITRREWYRASRVPLNLIYIGQTADPSGTPAGPKEQRLWAYVLIQPLSRSVCGNGNQSPHTDSLYAGVLVYPAPTSPTQQEQGHFARAVCRTAWLTLLPSGVVIINCCYSVLTTIPEV